MLTNSQEKALKLAEDWIRHKGKLLRIGGPAGSGKSYIIPLIADIVGIENCLLVTPTGKAANNLQKAGLKANTIHSTIYHVGDDDDDEEEEEGDEPFSEPKAAKQEKVYSASEPKFYLKDPDSFADKKLIIVDEGSMVGAHLLDDLMFFDVPVLLVGDPHQLAPVEDTSVFLKCDFYLEEIVRQAQGSPIIWLSQQVLNGNIPTGMFGNSMIRSGKPTENELLYATQVLTDTNKRRQELNIQMRKLLFGEDACDDPQKWIRCDERLVCRTNTPAYVSTEGFMLTNGTQGLVTDVLHRGLYSAEFKLANLDLGEYTMVGTPEPLRFPKKKRPPTVEYSYALTVHLSQGSEWDNVIYDLSRAPQKKALYTGITRAKNSLLVTL